MDFDFSGSVLIREFLRGFSGLVCGVPFGFRLAVDCALRVFAATGDSDNELLPSSLRDNCRCARGVRVGDPLGAGSSSSSSDMTRCDLRCLLAGRGAIDEHGGLNQRSPATRWTRDAATASLPAEEMTDLTCQAVATFDILSSGALPAPPGLASPGTDAGQLPLFQRLS
jgi:hypothetical protein